MTPLWISELKPSSDRDDYESTDKAAKKGDTMSEIVTVAKVHEVSQSKSYIAQKGRNAGKEHFPTVLRADVRDKGHLHENCTVQITGLKEGQHMLANHISSGTEICVYEPRHSDQYGTTYPVAISDTKQHLGLGSAIEAPGAHETGNDIVGVVVGAAMHDACTLTAATFTPTTSVADHISDIKLLAGQLFDVAAELTAEKRQVDQNNRVATSEPSPSHDPTHDLERIRAVLRDATELCYKLTSEPDAEALCTELWKKAQADEETFRRMLAEALNAEDTLPF